MNCGTCLFWKRKAGERGRCYRWLVVVGAAETCAEWVAKVIRA